eukprot:SAG22_NODE_5555_length_993_cov_2.322148_1_plen_141_part_10
MNLYDAQFGAGSCDVVATPAACGSVFAAGGRYQGYCDFACGFCEAPASQLTLEEHPPIPMCPWVVDEVESSHGVGACQALLHTGHYSCAVEFARNGTYHSFCDRTCGFCPPGCCAAAPPPPEEVPPPPPPSAAAPCSADER